MQDLTEKQKAVLDFMRAREAANLPVTFREIMAQVGFASLNSVTVALKALIRKGYVERPFPFFYRIVKDECGLELERLGKCWRTLPAYLRKELLHVAEHYQEAVTVHEEAR